MPQSKFHTFLLSCTILLTTLTHASPVDPKTVPVVDGAAGPCTADFTVTDPSSTAVYAATIKVHIAYGFMYARKLDLEVGTNSDGKARFTGLPDRTKQGLFFRASATPLPAWLVRTQ